MTCEHCSGTGTCSTSNCRRCNADRLCSVCQGFGFIGIAPEPNLPRHDVVRFPEEPFRKSENVLGIPQLADLDVKVLIFLAFIVAILVGSFASGVAAGWATQPVSKVDLPRHGVETWRWAHVAPQKLMISAESRRVSLGSRPSSILVTSFRSSNLIACGP